MCWLGYSMNNNRCGENGPVPFRAGRVINVDNTWYISTREGFERGPFKDKAEAEKALDIFIKQLTSPTRNKYLDTIELTNLMVK